MEATATATAAPPPSPLVTARPYRLRVPVGYDPAHPAPLLVLLHGYGSSGAELESFFSAASLADSKGVFVAIPDGTKDGAGKRFWNATDACCNFGNAKVDDVAYLVALLDDVAARHAIDPKRVFLVGHSNGGYFAHRAACERAERIAGIVSIAGMTWKDASKCTPSAPVAVAQIHGDADSVVHLDGGHIRDDPSRPEYPSARETVAGWAAKDHCTGPLARADTALDLDPQLAGAETTIERATGCPAGAAAELWTVHGMGHMPRASPAWGEAVWGFCAAHGRN